MLAESVLGTGCLGEAPQRLGLARPLHLLNAVPAGLGHEPALGSVPLRIAVRAPPHPVAAASLQFSSPPRSQSAR